MFLSNVAVRRPVALCCLIIALGLLGGNALRKMGLENMPRMDLPYVTVVTIYPGASPTEIETDVAKKIEDAVVAIDGLKHVTSSCMENACQTLLEFELEVDVDVAAVDVREKIDLILNDLPADAEKPKILKFDVNAKPIVNLALTGDRPLGELYDFADNRLSDRLSVIRGVAEIQLVGGAEREVHALLDRGKLASHGLTAMDVVAAVSGGIRTIPAGRIRQGGTEFSVKYDGEYDEVRAIGGLEVANSEGSRITIADLGRVVMTNDELRQAAFIDRRPCIAIRVVKKSDANAVKVTERVKDALASLKSTLPGGMELVWVTDDGGFIQASVDSAASNIWQGVLLTAAILFLFLYNIRLTLIVALTMPVTIVISLFFLHALDQTLNTSTLLALGLSIGVLVTNSIVVLESVKRRLASGDSPREAARIGASSVAVAVLASAGTNVVVLLPISVMGSIVGLFFGPFALTMLIATVVSLFISFTLTPIICSVLVKPTTPGMRVSPLERVEAVWSAGLTRISVMYEALLRVVMRRWWLSVPVLLVVFISLFRATKLAPEIGFSFMPDNDKGEIYVKLEYPTRYSLAGTVERTRQVEDRLSDMPGLLHRLVTIGKVEGVVGQSSEGVYLAQALFRFVDKGLREKTIFELQEEIRIRLAAVPDCIVSVNVPSSIGGQSKPLEMEISGDEFAVLDSLGLKASSLASTIDGVADLDTSVRSGKPEIRLRPRRSVLGDLGVTSNDMGMLVRAGFDGIEAGSYKRGDRTFDIRVKFEEVEGREQVAALLFPGGPGKPVTIGGLARVEERRAPVQITRNDKRRVSKIYANVSGKPLGTAVEELSQLVEVKAGLPPGYGYRFAGQVEVMQDGMLAFLEAGILALVLTYLTLAAILESFLQPLIILVTIPLALIGVLGALYMAGESMSMFVLVGMVMLVGIVVNNAILVLQELNKLVAGGVAPREAMIKACGDQLRPVLMITLAAVLGMLPLAIGQGLGAESRNGIGIASAGGIAVSAVLTLIVLPVLYGLFHRGGGTTVSSGS